MNSRDIALVSIFSAIWISSQIYLGPVIGQITTFHGSVQRFMSGLLMPILAELTNRFGRVSLMATIAALTTRIIRRSASLYVWVVGMGYALGGVTYDTLFSLIIKRATKARSRYLYLIATSLISGILTTLPYILYKLTSLGSLTFSLWFPLYLPRAIVDIGLNVLGTTTAILIIPKIKIVLNNQSITESTILMTD